MSMQPDDDKTRTYVPLTAGTMVSHYRIVEKIGAGGMGEVYLAEDTALNRKVALKFLPPHLCQDAECRARFKREAQAAAKLSHPNIITVFEVSEFNGRPFFALEHVEGCPLKEYAADKELDVRRMVELGVQVCEGLGAAHEAGVIHRDIKPSNILVDSHGRVRILDFGLAAVRGSEPLTKTGSTLGTLAYMSPEQVRGEQLDARSDLFSCGVVLYELITGKSPFVGETDAATLKNVSDRDPEPLGRYKAGVPDELQRIVIKALAKEKHLRYQHADDMAADLRNLIGIEPQATHRPRGKKRALAMGAGVLAIIILASILFYSRIGQGPTTVRSIAVLPFTDMSPQRDQEYFCDGMTEELINRLSNIKALRVPARTSAFHFKNSTDDVRTIGGKLNVQAVVEGSVRKAGDELRITAQLINVSDGYHLWSETYDRKLADVFAIQDEISSAIATALRVRLTESDRQRLTAHPFDNVKAYEYYLKASRLTSRFDPNSVDSALACLRAAIDIAGDNAWLYAGMSLAWFQYANLGMGQEEYLARSKEYADKAYALDPELPSTLMCMAFAAFYEPYPKNWSDALGYLNRALAVDSGSAEILDAVSEYYMDLGKGSAAIAFAEKLRREDPFFDRLHHTLGYAYCGSCQFDSALNEFRLNYLADTANTLALNNYASTLISNGKQNDALAALDQVNEDTADNIRSVPDVFCLLLKYALRGDKQRALQLITSQFDSTCRRDCEWSFSVAERLSLVGAKPQALNWLENSVHRGFINYPLLQCDPLLDNIRGEERFKKLMEWAKHEWEAFEV